MAASKRVIINVRVSDEVAQAIDQARAGQSRSGWVADVIDAALNTDAAPPAETKTKKNQAGWCPHPRARVIKGFCYACGKPATY